MPKNFFHKIIEAFTPSSNPSHGKDKSSDFERAKEILFSSETPHQLTSAVKYINNFNKKYEIRKNSPEFKYFERMILVMKLKIRSNRFDFDDELSEGDRMNRRIRNIIKESLDDFEWVKNTSSRFDPNFTFNEEEYWVDISKLNPEDKKAVAEYIKSRVRLLDYYDYENNLNRINRYNGLVVHCGTEEYDLIPTEGDLCFMTLTFDEDEDTDNSIYVDGGEVLIWIKSNNYEEELEESLEWSDKDETYGTDDNFSSDESWSSKDDNWEPNSEKSYWKQGDTGGSSGAEDINESDLDWIKDVSDGVPSFDQRTKVPLETFLWDFMVDDVDILDFLHGEEAFIPTEEFKRNYTPEDWDEYGLDEWRDGAWKDKGNSEWTDTPPMYFYEMREYIESGCDAWSFEDLQTIDYDLEYGSFSDRMIFQRNSDGRYFAFGYYGDKWDGINEHRDDLYEVFKQMVIQFV